MLPRRKRFRHDYHRLLLAEFTTDELTVPDSMEMNGPSQWARNATVREKYLEGSFTRQIPGLTQEPVNQDLWKSGAGNPLLKVLRSLRC